MWMAWVFDVTLAEWDCCKGNYQTTANCCSFPRKRGSWVSWHQPAQNDRLWTLQQFDQTTTSYSLRFTIGHKNEEVFEKKCNESGTTFEVERADIKRSHNSRNHVDTKYPNSIILWRICLPVIKESRIKPYSRSSVWAVFGQSICMLSELSLVVFNSTLSSF